MPDELSQTHLRVEVDGPVAVVSMSRPEKRNAISKLMMESIIGALDDLGQDDSVKVVLIQGEGNVFSAGWDRVELLDHSEPGRSEYVEVALAFYRALIGCRKPLIAAVEGYALGTAFDVALLADVRVCGAGARFAHPEVKLGGPCLYTPLKEAVGSGWARQLCLSGQSIDASLAASIGFVNQVVPDGSALAAARVVAGEMCDVPLETLVYTKSYLVSSPPAEDWLAAELDHVMRVGMTIQR